MPVKSNIDEQELINQYILDPKIVKLSKLFHIHTTRVKSILIKHGIKVKTPSEIRMVVLTEEQKIKALEIYTPNSGVSIVAKQLGVSRHAVNRFIKESGLRIISNKEGRLLTKEQELEVIEKYKTMSIRDIAIEYNCCGDAISNILKRNGITKLSSGKSRARKIMAELLSIKDEIINYFNKTNSLESTQKEFQISDKYLKRILRQNNIQNRTRKYFNFTTEEKKEIIDLYLIKTESVYEIADRYNCGYWPIRRVLVENNIEIRDSAQSFKLSRLVINGKYMSGYYKNHYFRSFNELSFMINYLEKKNIKWVSGERQDPIPYFDKDRDKNRRYYPDFFLENGYIMELKPKCFWNSQNVVDKKEAAITFCSENNLKYRLVDFPIIIEPIIKAYKNNLIKFSEISEEKFIKKYVKTKN